MTILLLQIACATPADPCAEAGAALSPCLARTESSAWYVDQGERYFDTLESSFSGEGGPDYADGVARWEWPPWLELTGYGKETLESVDAIIRLIPTSVPTRECAAFEEQPFTRCHVEFLFEDHPDQTCPIYEEFTFNSDSEMTFIEAWTDDPEHHPSPDPSDRWGEGDETRRLSTLIPGLGGPPGPLDLDSSWMQAAAADDEDVATFVREAHDFYAAWLETYAAAGTDVYAEGCGW